MIINIQSEPDLNNTPCQAHNRMPYGGFLPTVTLFIKNSKNQMTRKQPLKYCIFVPCVVSVAVSSVITRLISFRSVQCQHLRLTKTVRKSPLQF